MLHLLAHGAFKALLFLAAGSVIHAVGGATSMDAMGGLRDKLPDHLRDDDPRSRGARRASYPSSASSPRTPSSHGAYEQAAHGDLVWPWVAWLLLASMVVTAALTVAYSLRAWLLVFFGAGPDAVRGARGPGHDAGAAAAAGGARPRSAGWP